MMFYFCQESGVSRFPYRVEAVFGSKEEAKAAVLSGAWLAGYAGSFERSAAADSLYIVAADRKIGVNKCIPAQFIRGMNKMTDSKDPEVLAVVRAALAEAA